MSGIKPRILKGFRDILPEDMIIKEDFLGKIKKVFERYGFSPIETPALEYLDVLSGKGGEENEKLMYKFKDNGDRDVGLRYDLTVPLARFVSMNRNDINLPFKRYHISPVWRAENTQKGRFREFYQCDCDIVGSSSEFADAEIIYLIHDTLKALKIQDFEIRINSRVFIDGFFNMLNIAEDKTSALAVLIDKKDKMPEQKFYSLAQEYLDDKNIILLRRFLEDTDTVPELEKLFAAADDKVKSELERFRNIMLTCKEISSHIKFCPGIIRGLDYYTGIVYETVLKDSPEYGAIFSGGRYDNLIGLFSKEDIPAVGASIGISRLIAALSERGFFKKSGKSVSDIILLNFDDELTQEYFSIIHDLRMNGFKCDFYYDNTKVKKQFKFADKQGYTYALIMGKDEFDNGDIKIRNLKSGEEMTVKIGLAAEAFRN